MKRLVIFDLDGTLLDTVADLAAAVNYSLETLGFPTHETSRYYEFVGHGIYHLFRCALPADARTEENVMAVKSLFVPYYDKHNTDHTKPYPGIPQLMERLQAEGFLLAIASNKYEAATIELMKDYFSQIRFASIHGQREGIPVKPDPMIVYDICKESSSAVEECIYVGDSDVDIQTARNAGVPAIAVSWGFRPRAELASLNPDAIADTADELFEQIMKISQK